MIWDVFSNKAIQSDSHELEWIQTKQLNQKQDKRLEGY